MNKNLNKYHDFDQNIKQFMSSKNEPTSDVSLQNLI